MSAAATATPKTVDVLDQLPRLGPDELIPEINGLMIDGDGNLRPRQRKQQYIVTFDHKSRRVTARFAGGRGEPIKMELGCRLVRIPYSAENKKGRQELLQQIYVAQSRLRVDLTVTHHQWLYCRDMLILEPSRLTASWLVTQLTLAALCMQPTIELFTIGRDS